MDLQPIHHPPKSFVSKYLISYDHKVIAKQFLWSGLIFLALGGTMAMMIRWQLAFPGEPVPGLLGQVVLSHNDGVIGPAEYNTLFTSHGLIMIFFAITPLLRCQSSQGLCPLRCRFRMALWHSRRCLCRRVHLPSPPHRCRRSSPCLCPRTSRSHMARWRSRRCRRS